ncbi:MAG: tRNA (guanosine(46)-N7)-methyltransferase TrmB [Dokdonella sp.]|uniref:tRNA (guanosine(46)-N7)-methyltransferase TrmB n=1 Tax=Dokdonella sp. TaxID=2291710 RepID=UPI002BC173C6|nr:tRNA (guanosine(46)-N7)-methyltransferase TrmB [Xanthomonadales bacterium]MBL0222802.1 tRNA (guanosine(46)-N7)-methyltransferase TrmB [Xanthomonadales bacterium]HQW76417.1 tRNA (guanosine(46)-N7)-methyltransferase TrmB [Dokdonella sp.]HQY55572.1 tRNA (guanosine(46)-N7)-methyltransferase TrmB [Dokdonella sp.]HQZ62778.1 tRNA (guanosine(46)-N7)-methyltransferase TrmB [Dokdonella sp.]
MTDPRHTDRQSAQPGGQRRVRSFVLRQGRITPAQAQAFDAHWSRYGLDYSDQRIDLQALFARPAPVVLEIGFGNGEQLLHAAVNEPTRNFLGIEVHRPGVGRLMNGLAVANVDNIRISNHDAVEVIERQLAPDSLDEVRIYFPDPWPKVRHHKRRLIQPEFVELLATRVRSGGLLHLATDWAEYAEHMLAVVDGSGRWRNRAGLGAYSEVPGWRINTHFEKRGVRLGHGVWDLIFERV